MLYIQWYVLVLLGKHMHWSSASSSLHDQCKVIYCYAWVAILSPELLKYYGLKRVWCLRQLSVPRVHSKPQAGMQALLGAL